MNLNNAGYRKRGKPKIRCKDNVVTDLRSCDVSKKTRTTKKSTEKDWKRRPHHQVRIKMTRKGLLKLFQFFRYLAEEKKK